MYITPEMDKQRRLRDAPTQIRLWDGNWKLLDEIEGEYEHDFEFVNNDAGSGTLTLPIDHPSAELVVNTREWPTKSLYVTFDRDGARWSGRVTTFKVVTNAREDRKVELYLTHDYIKLKELLVWANPFLPAEVQFPKAWMLYGPARWAVTTTLFVNLLRKNNSLWMVPDDPLDLGQWFDLDMSEWNIAVKPVKMLDDNSLTSVISSRFKTFHDCVLPVLEDAQLTIDCRRYLEGDPDPIPGKKLRHGCLVVDVQDKSGWNKQTSFFGNTKNGLIRQIRRIGSDGLTEGLDTVPRVENPAEYSDSSFKGTMPEAPWVVLEHGEETGVEATEFEYTPPGASQFVTGGSSMPGVNEALKASMIGLGGLLGSLVGFQSQMGSVAEAILEPLYSDVFAAFMAHKQHDRIKEQGWDYPYEYWVDGSDKAYTLSALSALRKAKYETRERFACSVTMNNGAPYWVGPRGHGDFFVGDRVAVHALGMAEDELFVEQVESVRYSSSPDERDWEITVGKPEFVSGFEYLAKRYEASTSALKELGVW